MAHRAYKIKFSHEYTFSCHTYFNVFVAVIAVARSFVRSANAFLVSRDIDKNVKRYRCDEVDDNRHTRIMCQLADAGVDKKKCNTHIN